MEKEPNHSEDQKKKWERLSDGPSAEELAMATAEQIEIEDTHEGETPLTPQELAQFAIEFRKREIEWARMDAEREVDNIGTTDQQFVAYRKRLKAEGRTMTDKEFFTWEQTEYAGAWQRLQKYMRKCDIQTEEEEAELEYPMFFTYDEATLHETIEAQAGNYYRERAKELREKILASDDPQKEEDEKKLSSFYSAVNDHLDYKYMTPEDIRYRYGRDYEDYDRGRTIAHNNAILSLNTLNDLARKYGTTPFTPRNFWTSNKSNQTAAVARRMRYDRDVVEEYYAIAFSQEVAIRDRKLQRELRGY